MTAEDLKKSILQQAIQGKLVPQNPEDEPVSVLLDRIRSEKARLVAEGKIKGDKNESVIYRNPDGQYIERIGKTETDITDQIPFKIPDSWEWVRVKTIGFCETGTTPSKEHPEYFGEHIPFLSPANILNNQILNITQGLSLEGTKFGRIVPKDTILQVCIGGSIGKCAIVDKDVTFNQQINSITPIFASVKYIFACLQSDSFIQQIKLKATGTATPIINRRNWELLFIPIPPLAEQVRIVAKIEELMPMVEEYGKAQSRLDELNSALGDNIRKSVLQYAIQGKLVPQNPDEEPASVLLDRIRAEKTRLVAEGKIKRDKNESVIYRNPDGQYIERIGKTETDITDQIPFEIPDNWEWVNFGFLFNIQTGASFKKEQASTTPKGIRILRGGNILPGKYFFKDDDLYIDPSLVSNSILLNELDMITPAVTSIDNIGKIALLDKTYNDVSVGGFVFILRLYLLNDILAKYLCYAIQSPFVTNEMKSITKKSGSAFYNIGKERLNTQYIPLPPLAEQNRIVERINQILSLYK